jgi:flagellar FliJ protein
MSTPFPLQPVLDLARSGVDAAAARLGQATQALMAADRKLATLLDYRSEYQARLRDAVAAGIDSAGWHNFHRFLARLEAGIESARAQVSAARAAALQAQGHWQEQNRKLKAYDVLAQRHERSEQHADARREQRETDDNAARSYRTGLLNRPR